MNTWQKRDWRQFYELARRPWQRHRPPRPVYPSGFNRVLPAAGFSLSELDDAGVDLDMAESLRLQRHCAARFRALLPPTPVVPAAYFCDPHARQEWPGLLLVKRFVELEK